MPSPLNVTSTLSSMILISPVVLRDPYYYTASVYIYLNCLLPLHREDHLRPLNPTPYKVSVNKELYNFVHEMWLKESPIADLS